MIACALGPSLAAAQKPIARPTPKPPTTWEKLQRVPPAVRQKIVEGVGAEFINRLKISKGKLATLTEVGKQSLEMARDKAQSGMEALSNEVAELARQIASDKKLLSMIEKVGSVVDPPEAVWNQLNKAAAALKGVIRKSAGKYRSISLVCVGTASTVAGFDVPIPIPPCPPGIAFSLDGKRSALVWSGGTRLTTSAQLTKSIQLGLWTHDPAELRGAYWGIVSGVRTGVSNGFSFLWDYAMGYRGFTLNTKVGAMNSSIELGVLAGATDSVPFDALLKRALR